MDRRNVRDERVFKLLRAEKAKRRVQTMPVVPDFDEFKDGSARLSAGLELTGETFGFQGTEEALHDRIVVAVTDTAHADPALQVGQHLLVSSTGVLSAPVGMMKQTGSRAAAGDSPFMCLLCI